MKTLGLIGGMSWVSTIDYYRIINEQTNQKLGSLHSAKILLYSVNYEESKPPVDPREWDKPSQNLLNIARKLENAGADAIVLCANTPHMAADFIQQQIKIPLIHIAEETAKEIVKYNLKTVGLLGTKITMEQDFFKQRLLKFGIESLVPNEGQRNFIHATIMQELGKGIFTNDTKSRYLEIMKDLHEQGAEGIILGCTEIPMLIKREDSEMQLFDTTMIHATAAVNFALLD
jgi:aspartate racemase